MRHFLLLSDDREVLGVWQAEDEISAARLRLELALSYPGCRTEARTAESFEALKRAVEEDFDLDDVEPEGVPAPLPA